MFLLREWDSLSRLAKTFAALIVFTGLARNDVWELVSKSSGLS